MTIDNHNSRACIQYLSCCLNRRPIGKIICVTVATLVGNLIQSTNCVVSMINDLFIIFRLLLDSSVRKVLIAIRVLLIV